MVAVASRTALEDALLAQTPTALAPRHQHVAPMFLPAGAAAALLLVETPTADAHLHRETDTKHPGAATATAPDLALRFLCEERIFLGTICSEETRKESPEGTLGARESFGTIGHTVVRENSEMTGDTLLRARLRVTARESALLSL